MSSDRAEQEGSQPGKPPSSTPTDRARLIAEGSATSLPRGGTYFLGRYRIVDEIGVGGMASVHLARADGPGGFQKWVAIKRIHRHLAEDASFIQMFLDEARIAARVSHPNVAQVFDLGRHKDTYWIAMEYLHGEPLREVMRAVEETRVQRMDPELAAKIVSDAAEGLHAAHELRDKDGKLLNLVHRDVTPHNLFLTYDGAVKVVDFGIAKVADRMSTTRAGTLKGKLAYMSPEQVRGAAIDRRTDVFALGVVLWELTTGRRLFRMDSDLETLERVQACIVPPPSTTIEAYPVELESIVMRALAKDANKRFATARELSRSLQQYLMHTGSFVASDEIGTYVRDALTDRYQKREAHLQWAAEVTQTIALDQLEKRPIQADEVSMLTYSSDVLEVPVVRPATGASSASSRAPTSSRTARSAAPPPPSRSSTERALAPASSSVSSAATPSGVLPPPASRPRSVKASITDVEPFEHAREPPPIARPATPLGLGSTPPRFAPPALPVALPLPPPVAAPMPPPPPAPLEPPLPAFDLSATGDRAMVDDDDAPTTILGAAPHPQPHGISTVHAPAKSVPPPPAPAANVVIAELDSAPHHSLEVPSSEPTLRRNDAARGSRLLIGITAAATTLIALSLTTLVVLELTRKDEPPAAPPAPTTTTRPAPPPARAAVEPVATDQPVDPATLPTEDSALREGSELPEAATSTAAPIRAPATRTRSVPQRAGRTGYLTVVCDPICDSVHAAGKSLGPSPILGAALPAGGHAVMLRRKGARSRTIRVTIVSGQTTVQRVKMGS